MKAGAAAYWVEAFAGEVGLLVVLRALPLEEPFQVEALVEVLFLLEALVHLGHPSCLRPCRALLIRVVVPSFKVAFPSASAHLFPLASPFPSVEAASAVSERRPRQPCDAPDLEEPQRSL